MRLLVYGCILIVLVVLMGYPSPPCLSSAARALIRDHFYQALMKRSPSHAEIINFQIPDDVASSSWDWTILAINAKTIAKVIAQQSLSKEAVNGFLLSAVYASQAKVYCRSYCRENECWCLDFRVSSSEET